MKPKAETLVGFAIRANSYRTGVNSVATLKRAELLLLCPTASQNTVKEVIKLAKKLHARLYVSVKPLEEVAFKQNCKLIAITDKKFAAPIVEYAEGSFTEYKTEAMNG